MMTRLLSTVRHELLRSSPLSPALLKHEEKRATSLQSRIADAITTDSAAGSGLGVAAGKPTP